MELVTLQFCKCQDTECILSPSDIRIMSDIAARFLREASSVPTSDPYANLGAVCGYVEPSTEFQGIQRPEESRQSTAWQGPPPGLQSMPRGSATPPPPLPISSLASSPRQESAPSDTFFDALTKYRSQAAAAKETCLKALASQTASRVDLQVKFIRFLDSERARQEQAKRAIDELFGQDAKAESGPANSEPGANPAVRLFVHCGVEVVRLIVFFNSCLPRGSPRMQARLQALPAPQLGDHSVQHRTIDYHLNQ